MSKFIRYLNAQLKRTVKVYPVILIFTCLITACVMVLLSVLLSQNNSKEADTKISVGLVGDTSESYLDIGISVIKEFDSTKYYIELIEMEQDEAEKRLLSGELMGYIVVPEDFVESIVSGENKHLTYYTDNSPATFGPTIMNEIVNIISDLLIEAQSGIYSMIDVGEKYEVDDETVDDAVNELNLEYISTVLGREGYYDVQFIGIGNGLGFTDYYFYAFFTLLLMLWGMTCIHLRIRTDMSLPRLLKSRGVGATSQVICDYIPYFIIMYLSAVVLALLCAKFGKGMGLAFTETVTGAGDYFMLAVRLVPAVAVISAMQFLLYEMSTNIISGVLLQLVTTVGLAYASGFFYPLSYFPKSVRTVAEYLPTRAVFNYASTAFLGKNSDALMLFIFFVAFIVLSVAVRTYRMRGDRV